MSELKSMFRYPSMIKVTAFCAATFAFLSVLFKNGIVFIPEVTEVRISNILAICYGVYFGPAGAFGCALGNLIGDFAGSLSWISSFGFLANFLTAFLPYKLWEGFSEKYGERGRPSLKCRRAWLRILGCYILSLVPCCAILGFSMDIFEVIPAVNSFLILFCNNAAADLLGVVLLIIMMQAKSIPYWRDLMTGEPEYEISSRAGTYLYTAAILAFILIIITGAYICYNGIGFTSPDEYGNKYILALYLISTIICFALSALSGQCRKHV